MYDDDMKEMKKICDHAKKAGITALIIADVSAMMYAREIGMEVHVSTQANVSNYEAVKFYSKFADVIVLARELTLKQIKKISDNIRKDKLKGPSKKLVQIELFAHGAMCISISGKCHMSLSTYNFSANRGECLQNCRRAYKVTDIETGKELVIDNKYVMSPKDMCTIGFIDKILDCGVTVLKIEGRGRSPDYVYTVVKCYRKAADAYIEGSYTKEKTDAWMEELKTVYNRGYWDGYYLGEKLDMWANEYGSKATKEKQYIGKIINYFKKSKVAQALLEAGEIRENDEIIITGPTTGVINTNMASLKADEKSCGKAISGQMITFRMEEVTRKNDKLYVLKSKKNKTG
jgi:putative protease